jgi:hypothetical protein
MAAGPALLRISFSLTDAGAALAPIAGPMGLRSGYTGTAP